MASARQLQNEIVSKTNELVTLNAKLEKLRYEHSFHADVSVKFQLEKQIETTEQEVSKLDEEIQELEIQLANAKLRLQLTGLENLGEYIFVTCNRGLQDTDFRIHFSEITSQSPGTPQVYIIQGDEQQCHGSFIKRLLVTCIQEYTELVLTVGNERAAIASWDIELPSQDDLSERWKRLLFSLFDRCNPRYKYKSDKNYTAASFREEIKVSLYPVIVIQHDVKMPLDNIGRDLIQDYLHFFNTVQVDASMPQLVVFLNIIYPAKTPSHWRNLLSRFYKVQADNNYENELQKVFQLQRQHAIGLLRRSNPPCVLLKELSCVTRDDVFNWFERNDIGGGTIDWNEYCEMIIKKNECKNMIEIEGALIRVLKQLRTEHEHTDKMKGRY
jgi:hypothetical protein